MSAVLFASLVAHGEEKQNIAATADSVPLATGRAPLLAVADAQTTLPETGRQSSPETSVQALTQSPSPSQNVTINLIHRMVQRGLLPQSDADELIKQAENDAVIARAQAQADAGAAAQAAVTQQVQAALPPPDHAPDDAVRVTYVPEVVKAQIRDQIKSEVMAQAKEEHWAAPNVVPKWVTKFRFTGDVRVRGEGDFFPSGNDNTGAFPDFNRINTGAPFDVAGTQFSPQQNVDQNRYRLRLRVRLGAEVDLSDNFTAGLRIATGENNSPVTTNQSLGLANQSQGGGFSKYQIWLDRGFLKYELGGTPQRDLSVVAGRFDNPFFSTSEIVWDDDLGFDGITASGRYEVARGVTPFLVVGAFPVFNTDFNFAMNQPSKFKSTDKWLYGIQAGATVKPHKDWEVKGAAAYYYFDDVQGKLSSPFTPLSSSDQGDTDDTRPAFAQKGNTYRPIRNIVPTADNSFETTNQFQYFGLASKFHELALNGRVTYSRYEPLQVSLFGEYVKNLAFDGSAINAVAINNRGANNGIGGVGNFVGGDTGWIAGLKVGHAALEKFADWNLGFNYRYVESDAVVDGFTDSDFGLGGTNLKGYTVGGNFALGENVWFGLRWLSAAAIAGPPFKSDTVQLDVNGKF